MYRLSGYPPPEKQPSVGSPVTRRDTLSPSDRSPGCSWKVFWANGPCTLPGVPPTCVTEKVYRASLPPLGVEPVYTGESLGRHTVLSPASTDTTGMAGCT